MTAGFLSSGVFMLLLATVGSAADFSLRRSESTIRQRILQEVPLGSSFENVQRQISRHGWEVSHVSLDTGFLDQRTNPYSVVGAKSIRASLGDYRGFPFMVNVTVFWGFDKDGSLLDIWVWKTSDSL